MYAIFHNSNRLPFKPVARLQGQGSVHFTLQCFDQVLGASMIFKMFTTVQTMHLYHGRIPIYDALSHAP